MSALSSDSKIWNLIQAVEAQEASVCASSSAGLWQSAGEGEDEGNDAMFETSAGRGFGATGAFALPLPGDSSRQLSLRQRLPLQLQKQQYQHYQHQQYQQQPSFSGGGGQVTAGQFCYPMGEGNNSRPCASSGVLVVPPPTLPTLARSSSIKLAGIKLSRGNSLWTSDLSST